MWKSASNEFSWQFRGGVDLRASILSGNPGTLAECRNMEIAPSGGLRPVDGYEPYDGRTLPSEVKYLAVSFTGLTEDIAVDDILLDDEFGAGIALTAHAVADGTTGTVLILPTTGTFHDGADLIKGVGTIATISTVAEEGYGDTTEEEIAYKESAIARQMARIGTVPGSGDILGIVEFEDTVYAFRDGETKCLMYESSSAGWVQTECLVWDTTTSAYITGNPEFTKGGSFKFTVKNFYGHTDKKAIYGCNGKDKAFEYDGTTFKWITTGMATDTPYDVAEFRNHLFLVFPGGSLQHSNTGDPTASWTVVSGAAEFGLGEEVVGLSVAYGVLAIWTTRRIMLLRGTSIDDWVLEPHAERIGADAKTVQLLSNDPIFFTQNTFKTLSTTQSFGDFKIGGVSGAIDPLLLRYEDTPIASCVIPRKSQYRMLYSGGMAIILTVRGEAFEYTFMDFPDVPTCFSYYGESDDVYFGDNAGYVYKLDSGNTFAGEAILYYMRTNPVSFGSLSKRKAVRKLLLDMENYGGHVVDLRVHVEPGVYRNYVLNDRSHAIDSKTGDGVWDLSSWDVFNWYGDSSAGPETRIRGEGLEFMFTFASNEGKQLNERFTINGATVQYTLRGQQK